MVTLKSVQTNRKYEYVYIGNWSDVDNSTAKIYLRGGELIQG